MSVLNIDRKTLWSTWLHMLIAMQNSVIVVKIVFGMVDIHFPGYSHQEEMGLCLVLPFPLLGCPNSWSPIQDLGWYNLLFGDIQPGFECTTKFV